MHEINWYAVFAAAVSSFFLGGLWYSPLLFGKLWEKAANRPAGECHPAKVFGVSFVFCLIAAGIFAWLLGPKPVVSNAVLQGGLMGALVTACYGINYQFSNRGFILLAIDGGYHIVQFVIFGLLLGFWHR